MSSSMQVFNVGDRPWRFGVTEGGTLYAVATDVAKTFDYRDAANALRILDEDEKGTQIVSTSQVSRRMSVIYEDGLWELIFRSTKPEAKAIKKRVKEILREIRRTGSYSAAPARQLSNRELAQMVIAEADRADAAEAVSAQLSEELSVAAPKADKWQQYMNSDGLIGMTELAAILGISAVALTKKLVEKEIFRVMERDGKRSRTPRTKYLHNGMFETKIEVHNGHTVHVNYAHPSGADHIMDIFQHPLARIGA